MDTFDNSERDRIRAVLTAYMQQNHIGTPTLHKRVCEAARSAEAMTLKTLQRFLDGIIRIHDESVAVCASFAAKLPNHPTAQHALGEALFNFYKYGSDLIVGRYRVKEGDNPLSELTIAAPTNNHNYYLVTELAEGRLLRVYDGPLVFTGTSILAILKDRLMRSARVHMLHLNDDASQFFGLVYDDGPRPLGPPDSLPYQLQHTTLEKIP